MLADLEALRKEARAASLEEFVRKHPAPGLVLRPFAIDVDTNLSTLACGPGGGNGLMLAFVEKRAGANPFPMITLGRAANNDVVLPHSSVSKFHAYFRGTDRWSLTDAGSKLGTFVGERRLKPTIDQVALATGDGLRFAELAATFFLPFELHDWLRGERELPGTR